MPADLESRLAQYFDEVAEATHVAETPPPLDIIRVSDAPSRSPRRTMWTAAAVIALVAGAAATYAFVRRGAGIPTASEPDAAVPWTGDIPAGDPVLFSPAGYRLEHTTVYESPPGDAGAILDPSGRVLTINANAAYPATPQLSGETRAIGRRQVTAERDSSAAQIYYTVREGCLSIGVTTAEMEMWDGSVTELLGSLAVATDAVTFELPERWTSLGSGGWTEMYTAIVNTDRGHSIDIQQTPNTPLGVLMGAETQPRKVEVDGREMWIAHATTTAGSASLVVTIDGTTIRLSGDATEDELIAIVNSFVRAPRSLWTQPVPADNDRPKATYATPPAGCTVPPLELVTP